VNNRKSHNNRNWLYFSCLDPKAKTIGHWMQEAGYRTCIAGKWQLQSNDPPDYPGSDLRRAINTPVAIHCADSETTLHIDEQKNPSTNGCFARSVSIASWPESNAGCEFRSLEPRASM